MTTTDLPLNQQDTSQLAQDYWETLGAIQSLRETLGHYEMELIRRAERDSGGDNERIMAIYDPDYEITVNRKAEYDHSKLLRLFERGPDFKQALTDAGAYIPEHTESKIVPARFNVTKVRPFAKYGEDVRDTINAAAIMGAPKLHVKKKGP